MCLCLCHSQAVDFGVRKWPLLPDTWMSLQRNCEKVCMVLIYHVRLCDVVLLCFPANRASYAVGHLKAYICIKLIQELNPSSSVCSASLHEALKVAQYSH